jgi:anti-sigma B factor antagonist
MELRVESSTAYGCAVVTPVGEVDLSNVGRLRDALNEQFLHAGADVVVDLDQISFIDSAGLGALIGARRRAHVVNGSLTLVCNQERILRVLGITRLDRVFDIVGSHPAIEEPMSDR